MPIDRRQALGVLGVAGAALALGCGSDPGGACLLDPTLTSGPYWTDGRLQRADIRSDTTGAASPDPRPGVPLSLTLQILAHGRSTCSPLSGAQVDLWHCDAGGIYSDVASSGTGGQNFLRGYQLTDPAGRVTFTTIYPGWYPGRAVHIHVKVRLFDGASNATTEATTQLFFDDALTDEVFASGSPYGDRGARDTRNGNDAIYGGHRELLTATTGSVLSGYTGTVVLGVQVGKVSSG